MFSLMRRIVAALRSDAVSGVVVIAAAAAALVWANSPWDSAYEHLRTWRLGPAALHLDLPLSVWAADGLLAVFFFIVGNELKQELVHGELRNPRRAAIPIVAALAGAIVPAGVFLAVTITATGTGSTTAVNGWGIPMATDIAFAVAVLAVAGRRLPLALRTFLLTLATVDDICAVVVIAVAYTGTLDLTALGLAAATLAVFGYLQHSRSRAVRWIRAAVPGWLLFGPLAVLAWALTHQSGIHATMAGVAMGLLMRTKPRDTEAISPSHRAEALLRPVSAGIALPVFALTSAGISLSGMAGFWSSSITWGLLAALVGGKLIGIVGGAWLTTTFTTAHLNPELGWADITAVGLLGGIGFTVSLLIAELSYTSSLDLAHAKGAVLLASATAATLAAGLLLARSRAVRYPRGGRVVS